VCTLLSASAKRLSTVPLHELDAVMSTHAGAQHHPSVDQTLRFGPDTAQVSAVPAGDRAMDLHLFFFGSEGQPIDPAEVKATLRLPKQDLGPLPVTLQSFGGGHDIGNIAVPVPGDWTLTVSARTGAIDEFDQKVTLPIR